MALPSNSEVSPQPTHGGGLPMRERLRIFGIGAGIGLMMVGLYFAGRKQMADLAAAEAAAQAAQAAAASGQSNSGPNAAGAPAPSTPAAPPSAPVPPATK